MRCSLSALEAASESTACGAGCAGIDLVWDLGRAQGREKEQALGWGNGQEGTPCQQTPAPRWTLRLGLYLCIYSTCLGQGGGLQESLPFYEVSWTRLPPPFLLTVLPVPWHRLHPWRLLPRSGWLNGELLIAPNLPARAGGWGQMSSSSSPLEVSPFCTSPAASPGQCPPCGDQRWVQCSDTAGLLRGAAGAAGPWFRHSHVSP